MKHAKVSFRREALRLRVAPMWYMTGGLTTGGCGQSKHVKFHPTYQPLGRIYN